MSRELLTVIIPSLNEENTIAEAAEAVLEVVPRLPVEVEILLVDDGSTDGTRAAMEAVCARNPRCRLRVNPRNLGVGRSVVASYPDLPPESWVTVFPGDNEFIFESIENHLAVRDRYDLILGYVQNPVVRTIPRRIASQSFIEVTRFLYGFPYRYLNGMKLYKVRVFQGLEVISGGHSFNAELIAKAVLRDPHLRIGEVPFVQRGRTMGTSKAVRPRALARAVKDVVRGFRSVSDYREAVVRGPDRRR
jgi:glycosyltransferase involved in cell wall biosynthesis